MIKKKPAITTVLKPQETKLFCDLFYITPNSVQLDFLIAVTEFGLVLVRPVPTKTAHQLSLGLKEILSVLKRYDWSVSAVRADNEGGIGPALELIHGPPHEPVGAGTHVGQVEERIRRVKDNYRSLQASLAFKFGDAIATWAVRYAAYVLNLTPMRHSPQACPREILTGIKPDFKVVLPVAFGDLCQVREKKTSNSVTEFRNISALALLPSGAGSVLFVSLTTGRVISRDQFTIIRDAPKEYLIIIKALQERGVFAIEGKGDDIGEDPITAPSQAPSQAQTLGQAEIAREDAPEDRLVVMSTVLDLPIDSIDPNIDLKKMKINEAIKLYGQSKTEEAIMAELSNMIKKEVFAPVPMHDQRAIPSKCIIPSMLFLKYKDGKLKARLVAGGHRQDDKIYDRLTSPTIKNQTIFCLVAFAAEHLWFTATFDIGCAYLNASRSGLKQLYIKLNKAVMTILVKMDPTFQAAVSPNGSGLLEAMKAIYGTIEAASLWYQDASGTLIELGFRMSEEDPCLFIGKGILVGLYVDDFLVISKSRDKIERLKRDLSVRYDEVKANIGANLNFLGMNFKFIETRVHVSIPLSNVLEGVTGTKPTPAGMNLFAIQENSEPLSDQGAKEFHSTVAKLLYIAKRTRGDVLLPVNFLATRVKNPTVDDLKKLNRVLQNLNETKSTEMTLSMDTEHGIVLQAYIDASYAVHSDFKSHSGVMFTIGTGPVYVSSTKQSCVSKSSTEAEIIAITDYVGEALSTKRILEDITGKPVKLIIHQDNQAVLHILKHGTLQGKSKTASKHVKVRVAWMKERIDAGDFEVGYCSTDLMKSDGLTKPKTVEDHFKFQADLGMTAKERAVRFGTVRVMGETTTKKISPEDPELEVKTRSKGFGNLKEID